MGKRPRAPAGIRGENRGYENNLYGLSTEGSENGGDAFTAFSAMSHTCFTGMADRDPSTNVATPTALLALLCQECVSK